MTIKFNKSEAYNDAKQQFTNALTNGDAKAQNEALLNLVDVLKDDVSASILTQVQNENMDKSILASRGQNVLTSNELKFFNEVIASKGFEDEAILPETTQDRIFEDLTTERPLLAALGLQDLGAVTRFIYSDATRAYAWNELFGNIDGQIKTAFRSESIGQLKLTAFAVIPNDMLELGPVWVERYVRTVLVESYAEGLEFGFVNGGGSAVHQPIGLLKDLNTETGAVTAKASTGTLTFAPSERGETVVKELHGVVKELSTNAKGDSRKVLNKITMVVNPIDVIAVQARNTIQNANGQWVTSLPYNIQTIESEQVPVGKALFFVQGEYLAAMAGGYKIKKYDQTFAVEDSTLYTIKQFANGRPKDNKAALVYDLNIDLATAPAGA